MSSLFVATPVAGATAGAALTVPMSTLLGGWRDGLLAWGIIAAVLILP